MNSRSSSSSTKNVFTQIAMAVPISLLVFGALTLLLLIGFEVVYADRVYPGVSVNEIDLAGKSIEEANTRLSSALSYAYEGSLQFTDGDEVWEARPIDLGYRIDPQLSAKKAYDLGRASWFGANWVAKGRAWFKGAQLPPVVLYDERVALAYLQSVAKEVDQPTLEASLALKDAEVVVKSGQIGREVDLDTTLEALYSVLTEMKDGTIPLVVKETPPLILNADAQAELARKILSEPLVLSAEDTGEENNDPRSWSIPPETLATMLTIERVDAADGLNSTFEINPNEALFKVYLQGLAPGLRIYPVNARFIFNDDTNLLDLMEPAIIGRTLNIETSLAQINEAIQAGTHKVSLEFDLVDPAVTSDISGEELGITELFHQETTYFYGSEPARVQNIKTAAAQFHGLLIPPGVTFSMADALGNISLENGYAEALIIYGGQTIQGVGGGVCQVSTNLFRAAFFAGLPIVERHAHAYRVSYYEQRSNGSRDANLAGLDATVYVPIVDFKFTNDTGSWLLMETYMGNFSLTWKFYGTRDGRSVSWQTTGPTNVIPAPEPLYRENANLSKGVIKQVDYAADGADVSVTRTVYKNDQVHFSDSFFTRFRPWQAIFEYGPGTEDIPDSTTD